VRPRNMMLSLATWCPAGAASLFLPKRCNLLDYQLCRSLFLFADFKIFVDRLFKFCSLVFGTSLYLPKHCQPAHFTGEAKKVLKHIVVVSHHKY